VLEVMVTPTIAYICLHEIERMIFRGWSLCFEFCLVLPVCWLGDRRASSP